MECRATFRREIVMRDIIETWYCGLSDDVGTRWGGTYGEPEPSPFQLTSIDLLTLKNITHSNSVLLQG